MLGALVIVFREVIEAGLIVGIVMAATRGVAGRGRWVTYGVIAGVLGATVVAFFAGAISQAFEGAGQELFNDTILGIAVVLAGTIDACPILGDAGAWRGVGPVELHQVLASGQL